MTHSTNITSFKGLSKDKRELINGMDDNRLKRSINSVLKSFFSESDSLAFAQYRNEVAYFVRHDKLIDSSSKIYTSEQINIIKNLSQKYIRVYNHFEEIIEFISRGQPHTKKALQKRIKGGLTGKEINYSHVLRVEKTFSEEIKDIKDKFNYLTNYGLA